MNSKYTKAVRGKLYKYFKQRLGIKSSTKGWYRSDCPYCGGTYTFGINFGKYRSHCFKCGETTNPVQTLMFMQDLKEYNEAWKFLSLEQEFEEYEDDKAAPRLERKEVILPESFRLISIAHGLLGKAAQRYIVKKRKFNLLDLSMRGVGYCLEGEYSGYIVFPFYEQTKLTFFQGRKFMGGGPKMKNPENERFGIGKTEIIYNSDAMYIYSKINLVESITNALTLGDNTIAILGKMISPYQLDLILNSPCTHVTIILDSDALLEAYKLAMKLVQYKKVKVVRMPKDQDVNDIGRKATRKLIKETDWGTHAYFFKQKLNA